MKVLIFFDDTVPKSEAVRDVIGDKGFSQVVVKKHRLEEYYEKTLRSLYPDAMWQTVLSPYRFQEIRSHLSEEENVRVLHCFSNFIFSEKEKALLSFEKLNYIDVPYIGLLEEKPAFLLFPDIKSYGDFLGHVALGMTTLEAAKQIIPHFTVEGMVNIGQFQNFIQCITGNFDSRYFNSVNGDEYILTKRSTDKRKIKAEYTYYRLLPDDMKSWFVIPYNYEEDEKTASYRMEHLHMTDLAIRWVHGSVDEEEFKRLMDLYFHFFSIRHKKSVSEEEYSKISDQLYRQKVLERLRQLKKHEAFSKLEYMLEAGRNITLDDLANRYFLLKEKVEKETTFPYISVIGHGDPCFANTLYSKSAQMMKFIDPKGALVEADLWTNPYYDIAKLSHSVCGSYDFFNNGLFEIRMEPDFMCQLYIDFDKQRYVKLFRKALEENHFNYLVVRVYEVSLFLSMLPLHMDNPFKVFGFILNAEKIIKEIENEI